MTTLEKDKRTTVEAALDDGIVMLHIDSRRDGVEVPGHLLGDPRLLLNIAHGFRLPALEVDDDGVYAVLRFGNQDCDCRIPWDAIYAITQPEFEQKGVLWPASMPAEALAAAPELGVHDRVLMGPTPPPEPEKPAWKPTLIRSSDDVADEVEPEQDPAEHTSDEPSADLADGVPDSTDDAAEEDPEPEPPSPPRSRGHLRLVK